jgi:chemotaxis protein MotB
LRKPRMVGRVNHERWLVSYADFITLLFAFFVVMFATAQADKSKAKQVSESVRDALEHGDLNTMLTVFQRHKPHDLKGGTPSPPSGPQPNPKPADLAAAQETLRKALDMELKSGKLAVTLESRGLVISMREASLFASGDDTIGDASYPMIGKVAEVILELPNAVRLEGYTDSVPIHNSRFRSNWELSTARSIAVLDVLADRFGVPRRRTAVAGYADNAPVDSNETTEGRAHNRRVDVVLLSAAGLQSEPGQSADKKEP